MSDDLQRLMALAERLGCAPARVLIAAAREVESDRLSGTALLSELESEARFAHGPFEDSARLALTPVPSFARDNSGSALRTIWKVGG